MRTSQAVTVDGPAGPVTTVTASAAGSAGRQVAEAGGAGRLAPSGLTGRSIGSAASLTLMAAAALLTLTGCVAPSGDTDGGTAGPPATTSASTATPTAPAAAAALVPEGSAADNQPYFDQVNRATIAANAQAGGVEFTSNLRTAGFDIAAMQVTPDVTTVGVAADSVQFSVKWTDACLIGQYGHGTYTSIVAPVLGTGTCLIGQTRAIDW